MKKNLACVGLFFFLPELTLALQSSECCFNQKVAVGGEESVSSNIFGFSYMQ